MVEAPGMATRARRVRAEDQRQGPLVLGIFVVAQVLDGLLTYWGVSRFGIDLEMNALLASTMHEIGPGATLLVAKGLACGCGLLLYTHAYLRPLAAVSGLCLGLAVLPWLFVFVSA
jgi:hypothetical protein